MQAFRSSRWIVLIAVLTAVGAFVADRGGWAVADGPEAIASAPDLRWGFKQSWRGYVGLPQLSGGASATSSTVPYDLEWDFASGSYDPDTQTTRIAYSGSVRWQSHKASVDGVPAPPGYTGEPDPYILDVTLSDPEITIGATESVLTAVAASRDRDTWQLVDYGRVPIVNLDVLGVTPTVAGGATAWDDIVSVVAAQGREVFGGFYLQGQVVDPVGFSYEGPGGAPDFSEHWDVPGAPKLKLLQNVLFYEGDALELQPPLWVDRKNLIVHSGRLVNVGGTNFTRVEAFSLKKMATVAQIDVPRAQLSSELAVAGYDTNQNRIFTRGTIETGMPRWLKFDPVTETYSAGAFTDPQMKQNSFINPSTGQKLAWDPTRERGYRVQRIVPAGVGTTEYDLHEWKLITYREGSDGIWVKQMLSLPGFPAGQNQNGYAQGYASNSPRYATASDGSLVVLATARSGLSADATIPGAYRLTIDDATEAVTAQPLPGTDVKNAVGSIFTAVQTGPGGHVALLNEDGTLTQLRIGDGGQVDADPPVSIKDNFEPGTWDEWRLAIDPDDGLAWFGGNSTQKIAALRDGEFLGADFSSVRNPRGGPVLVGEDGIVYAQTSNGAPAESGGSSTWGFGKYEQLGFVPTVTAQPQDDAVALGVGEASEAASFTSTASGDPAPQRQWQVKEPGSLRFADLDGEAGETLTVAGTRDLDGAEYRAVYSNAAGKVATGTATLDVSYAPAIQQDPINVAVTEGTDAGLALVANGDPAPAVAWERRVLGYWQEIAPGDPNFEIEGQRLTVLETNTEQSGSLFRAKLTNPLGGVTSKVAKLTVNPKLSIPAGGIDLDRVSLEWTGNAEMQKAPPVGGSNYFSAGRSDGDEASYRSVEGNAAIYQVGAGGEALATWSTRAAHVGGGQLVRLYGGGGRIEPDGSVTVAWDGAFSVNFYGGLVPFTVTDPELEIDAGGAGTLSADLSGYASSIANPSERSPLAPVPDVVISTFSGVEIDPGGEIEIAPDYAGVQVTAPVPFAAQDRVSPGWGAWPQPFVDFHGETGLASYWYSSGGAFDPDKPPAPFAVDFEGEAPPAAPPPDDTPGSTAGGGGSSQPPQATPHPQPQLLVAPAARLRSNGLAVLLQASCPGPGFCALGLPRKVKVKFGGDVYWPRVIAPRVVRAGGLAQVKVKLPKAVVRGLRQRSVRVRLRVVLRSQAGTVRRTVTVRLKRKLKQGKEGPAPGAGQPQSGAISNEPPLLARPAGAVDVTGVRVAWHPRDSWVRYSSSGVSPGDGILTANGATGTAAKASPCPDRPSTSDAELPYTIEFAPRASWYDPASGTAAIYGQGSVSFRWAGHGIDLTASDPEIEINGAASRAIFRFSGSGGTAYPNQRAVLTSLDLRGRPVASNGGRTLTYDLMRGVLTADGVNVFAGFYTPPDNDEFGCVSVSFTTP